MAAIFHDKWEIIVLQSEHFKYRFHNVPYYRGGPYHKFNTTEHARYWHDRDLTKSLRTQLKQRLVFLYKADPFYAQKLSWQEQINVAIRNVNGLLDELEAFLWDVMALERQNHRTYDWTVSLHPGFSRRFHHAYSHGWSIRRILMERTVR
ncbi:MAG: hypothetical protein Q9184_006192 [Pyrenodesmia sp. 2 TL-2023]